MYQNGEILKVAFLKRRPFSLGEEDRMTTRQKSISAQINSVISQMAYGQASHTDLSNVFQKGWDSANKQIKNIEEGQMIRETMWVQIGDEELGIHLRDIEADPNFIYWENPDLIEQIKKSLEKD